MGKQYTADKFIKDGATANDILLGDGSSVPKSDLIINIENLGDELSGVATLATGNNAIDFQANIHYDKTLDSAWSPTLTNPVKGKSIVIMATGGAYTLTLPASVTLGDVSAWDGTLENQLTIYCYDSVTPKYSVSLLNV